MRLVVGIGGSVIKGGGTILVLGLIVPVAQRSKMQNLDNTLCLLRWERAPSPLREPTLWYVDVSLALYRISRRGRRLFENLLEAESCRSAQYHIVLCAHINHS
jgi:hypothetical protein